MASATLRPAAGRCGTGCGASWTRRRTKNAKHRESQAAASPVPCWFPASSRFPPLIQTVRPSVGPKAGQSHPAMGGSARGRVPSRQRAPEYRPWDLRRMDYLGGTASSAPCARIPWCDGKSSSSHLPGRSYPCSLGVAETGRGRRPDLAEQDVLTSPGRLIVHCQAPRLPVSVVQAAASALGCPAGTWMPCWPGWTPSACRCCNLTGNLFLQVEGLRWRARCRRSTVLLKDERPRPCTLTTSPSRASAPVSRSRPPSRAPCWSRSRDRLRDPEPGSGSPGFRRLRGLP
jgi:hypothetical protein